MIPWSDWGASAFERAAREGKPVLLALVAAWSHGAAEMDRAAFSDPDVQALVAARVVPVRVDADARPDINERYNLGGCPTVVFLTPGGDVLWGATFLEAAALRAAVDQVSRGFAANRDEIERRAAADRARAAPPPAAAPLDPRALDRIAGELLDASAAPLEPAALAFLLQQARAGARPAVGDRLRQWTDHLSGDVLWERPEDNAALLVFLVDAAAALEDGRLAARVAPVAAELRATLDAGRAPYVDTACAVAGALVRAGDALGDGDLLARAIAALERAVGTAYRPGRGLAHVLADPERTSGLLCDHVRAAGALLAAHAVTFRLPYAMLADELMQGARRRLWDEAGGGFFDRPADDPDTIGLLAQRVKPFVLNCDAARVLCALAALHHAPAYRDAAVLAEGFDAGADLARTLGAQAAVYHEYGPLAAHYGLALADWLGRSW